MADSYPLWLTDVLAVHVVKLWAMTPHADGVKSCGFVKSNWAMAA